VKKANGQIIAVNEVSTPLLQPPEAGAANSNRRSMEQPLEQQRLVPAAAAADAARS
jgi:hypothetical protein